MTTFPSNQLSPVTLARIGGLLYLGIIVFGLFSEVGVRTALAVPNDPAATAENILNNALLFRIAFVADLGMLMFDLSLALIFYKLLKPTSPTLAMAALLTRLAMDATLGLNMMNHFLALMVLDAPTYMSVFSVDQLQAVALFGLQAHAVGYSIGLIFFAFHCLVLGYLLYRSDLFPSVFGPLLALAFGSYLIDSAAKFLIDGYSSNDYPLIMIPALIAEVSLCLWLLIKGVRRPDSTTATPLPSSNAT
ncbi:DUF4386 domain-containing protein [Saccharospirillum alexandrii]|uniref:DUF4386 domain-containing protein n=1 Tax=Saccharospirillum alexandrii TaxID=2448477 RepID=UPI000FDB1F31|nr:DUF4386 domain-containing protein [Saccharospirillum alexandrii]